MAGIINEQVYSMNESMTHVNQRSIHLFDSSGRYERDLTVLALKDLLGLDCYVITI